MCIRDRGPITEIKKSNYILISTEETRSFKKDNEKPKINLYAKVSLIQQKRRERLEE